MKTKLLLLNLILIINIISCNGQDKKSSPNTNTLTQSSIENNFLKIDKLYFDSDEKLIFSTSLIKDLGKFTIYFLPIADSDIQYYNDFEKNNNIKPLYDELNSLRYFSTSDQKKIDSILKKKIKSETNFIIIGTYIPQKFILVENNNEYSINFPYVEKYYYKDGEKWKHLFEKTIKNSEDDLKYNSKTYFISELTNNQKENSVNEEKEKLSIQNEKSAQSIVDGTYKYIDCTKNYPSLYITNNIGQLNFYTQKNMWVSVSTNIINENNRYYLRYNFLTSVSGKNKDLDWDNFSTKENFAELKIINNEIEINWLGFYNTKTKKRDFTINPFTKTKEKSILIKCE